MLPLFVCARFEAAQEAQTPLGERFPICFPGFAGCAHKPVKYD